MPSIDAAGAPGASLRLFVAVELPDAVKADLARCQRSLALHTGTLVRWVEPAAMHLTLKFLGDVDSRRLHTIEAAVTAAASATAPLTLGVDGLGAFPNLRNPRVIWVGLTGELNALAGLQTQLDANFDTLGFARENRPFSPHLTLGRVREGGPTEARRQLEQVVGATTPPTSSPFRVETISLMRSTLTPRGAIYDRLALLPLAAVLSTASA